MPLNARPLLRPSFRNPSGVAPVRRDLLVVALILFVVDVIGALLLIEVYRPRRRREALAAAPAQLSLLARDRQNALTGWVRERIADAELTASRLAQANGNEPAAKLVDDFVRAYGYESAFLVERRTPTTG